MRGLLVSAALLLAARAHAEGAPLDLRHAVLRGERYMALGPRGWETTTLEPRLQKAAERLLARSGVHEGAIVASDVRSGRILAWASRGPGDYVATARGPSASVFKLVTATELLESGAANPDTRVCFEGGEHGFSAEELERRGGTCAPLREALGKSLNLVFAKLARDKVEPEALRHRAAQLGFSGKVPIDLPVGPSLLTIPEDPYGKARAAAGFWNGRTSPLGVLFAMQTIARGGEALPLRVRESSPAEGARDRVMRVSTARTLRRMLELTTRSGTCARAFHDERGARLLPGVSVAAKTGTLTGGSPPRMYSWFTAFAPSREPELALTVFLGNDVSWTTKANLLGRQLLEAWFEKGEAEDSPSASGTAVARRGKAPSRAR